MPDDMQNNELAAAIVGGESTSASVSPSVIPDPRLPCPYSQGTRLQQALSSDKMRVGFFLGAGCAVSIRVADGDGTRPLIPDIDGLTETIRKKMQDADEYKEHFGKILKQLNDCDASKRTIEDILTQVRRLIDVVGTTPYEGMSKEDLTKLDKTLCSEISCVMKARLPDRQTPYHNLAAWIGSIPRSNGVEVFTSNYDLLMEQALEECGVPYFDGFSGSDRTFFDTPSMEQSTIPSRWARLWKLHGSINWWRTPDGEFQRKSEANEGDSQMIHPSHLKYDQSRIMPYLAMQDRLRAFLARGQAVLITCGYSFADWHLNQAILQGLGGNPKAVCFGLVFGDRATATSAIAKVGFRGNLRLLCVDGGVIGTIDRDWHSKVNTNHELHGWAVCNGSLGSRSKAPDERCKFLLGNFKTLGEFLADQLARHSDNEEERNAN